MAKSFPNLMENIDLHTQKALKTQNKMNTKKNSLSHITLKLLKTQGKEKILRATKEKR